VHPSEDFGGEHDVAASGEGLDGPSDDLLGGVEAVDGGGIPKCKAELDGLTEDRRRFFVVQDLGHSAGVRVAEAPTAVRQAADRQSG
jgi:hypothetical protein